jgi:hypothetical protein
MPRRHMFGLHHFGGKTAWSWPHSNLFLSGFKAPCGCESFRRVGSPVTAIMREWQVRSILFGVEEGGEREEGPGGVVNFII